MRRLAALSCVALFGVLPFARISAQRVQRHGHPTQLFEKPNQIAVYEPPGRAWVFFHRRKTVAWIDTLNNSVFYGTERSSPLQWFRKLFTRDVHHAVPWQGTRAWVVDVGPNLQAFTIAPDGQRIYVFANRMERYDQLDQVWSQPGTFQGVTSVAASKDRIYVSDPASSSILTFSSKGVLDSDLKLHVPVPDRLEVDRSYLYGFSFSDKRISRYKIVNEAGPDQVQAFHSFQSSSEDLTIHSLADAVGFTVFDGMVYILDAKGVPTAVSFSGGGVHNLDVNGIAGNVRQLSHTSQGLLLADYKTQNFQLLKNITPATLFTKGLNPSHSVNLFYLYLANRELLPTTTAAFNNLAEMKQRLASVHLDVLSPNGELAFCKLNLRKAPCLNTLTFPADINIPNLHTEQAPTTTQIALPLALNNSPPIHTLGDVFAATTSSSTLRPHSLQELTELNPRYKASELLSQSSGVFTVPVDGIRFDAFVSNRRNSPYLAILKKELDSESLLSVQIAPDPKSAQSQHAGLATPPPGDLITQLPVVGSTQGEAPWLKTINAVNQFASSRVGVVDYQFQYHHTIFLDSHFDPYDPSASLSSSVTNTTGPAGDPTHPLPQINDERDHGTHVAGLIAGTVVNEQRYGVNPEAHLFGVKVNDFVAATQYSGYKIFNISLGEEDFKRTPTGKKLLDSLTDWFPAIHSDTAALFVVAAGNENTDLEKVSNKLALLGQEPNVITVMASNDHGSDIWRVDGKTGTNYGSPVGLVAPGSGLVSATFDNGWAVASGTSQATALVSGAASLLKGMYPKLTSWQIKQRLISTSNISRWSQQFANMSTGGLLDVDAAVTHADKTVVFFKGRPGSCVGEMSEAQMLKKLRVGQLEIDFGDIRRINYDGHLFTIWYSYADGKDNPADAHVAPIKPRIQRLSFGLQDIRSQAGVADGGAFTLRYNAGDDCQVEDHRMSMITDLFNGFYDPF